MKLVIIKKWYLNSILLIIMVLVVLMFFSWKFDFDWQVNSTGYFIRDEFPPLVFLPKCELGPRITANASVLLETKSGMVIYTKNSELRRAPASTTKMMTAIVALEKGRLNQEIKVSRLAAGTPGSSIYLRSGERLTLKQLLTGMMLQSGNDGSIAVAEGVAGSMDDFVKLMNLKAKEIGALKTNFRNPHGLRAPSHYTTALDLALIARYGLSNPHFARLVKQRQAVLEWIEGRAGKVEIKNTNRLLWYLEGADGVKTGTTNEAGKCLVASATRYGKQFIAVVLNSPDRWGDCARLLEYGFQGFTTVKIANQQESVGQLPVINGAQATVELYPRVDLTAEVRKGEEKLIIRKISIFSPELTAPVRVGQVLGKIGYEYQGQFVAGVDLIAKKPIRRLRRWFWW